MGVRAGAGLDRHRRGVETGAVVKIERQFQLNETVLRALVTVDEDGLETQTGSPRERAEAATAPAAETKES